MAVTMETYAKEIIHEEFFLSPLPLHDIPKKRRPRTARLPSSPSHSAISGRVRRGIRKKEGKKRGRKKREEPSLTLEEKRQLGEDMKRLDEKNT